MKTLYETILVEDKNRSKEKKPRILPCFLGILIPAFFLCVFQIIQSDKEKMDWLIQNVTSPIKYAVSSMCAFVPFAVAEIIWLIAILAAIAFLIRTIVILVTRHYRLRHLIRRSIALISALLIIYSGYTAMWGINYYGSNFSDLSGIEPRGASPEELAILTSAFVSAVNTYAPQVERSESGEFSEDISSCFSEATGIYANISQEFPFLSKTGHAPKPMLSSPIISRFDFTGFFFPFTAESLINVDCPPALIPSTMLHELAHQKNIAAEDECNFVAILTGIRSNDSAFIYSSALLGFIYVGNALYSISPDTYRQIRSQLCSEAQADLSANSLYWSQFTSPVEKAAEKVSNTVYDGFLQSYGQTEGLRTYGRCVDLLVSYYFDYYWKS